MNGDTTNCPYCGQNYTEGITGVADGCDQCLHIQRDSAGRAWRPGEAVKKIGSVFSLGLKVLSRNEAFNGGRRR